MTDEHATTPHDDDPHAVAARSFDAAAEIYEASRPDYPAAAVDAMLPDGAVRVLDLGAGTGKLTGALIERGLDVVAVDPSASMLEVLVRRVPGARAVVATAEALPRDAASFDAASFDVVTVAQAWHWVDAPRASAEVARVLRPGGTLSLVWNIRDESVEWIRRFGEIAGSERSFRDLGEEPLVGPGFGPFERAEFPWSRSMTRDEVLDLVRSRSWFLTADEDRRHEMIRDISRLVDDASIDGMVEMAYVTEVFRTRTAD